LDVESIFLRGDQLAIQALAAGDPPIMSTGQVVQANLSGFDLALTTGVESYDDSTIFRGVHVPDLGIESRGTAWRQPGVSSSPAAIR
jgi:hypothetical protein